MTTAIDRPAVSKYLWDQVGFKPTPAQESILSSPYRFNLVAGGEQAGKSMIAAKYLLSRFLETEGKGLY